MFSSVRMLSLHCPCNSVKACTLVRTTSSPSVICASKYTAIQNTLCMFADWLMNPRKLQSQKSSAHAMLCLEVALPALKHMCSMTTLMLHVQSMTKAMMPCAEYDHFVLHVQAALRVSRLSRTATTSTAVALTPLHDNLALAPVCIALVCPLAAAHLLACYVKTHCYICIFIF